MKNNHLKRYFFSAAITVLIAIMAVDANAANQNATRSGGDTTAATGEWSNNNIVASPYWQVDSGSYTFVAVSHSSLSGMASQIGVKINAITNEGTAYDTAEEFTIAWGTTERVFIVPTNHTTINTTAITTAKFLAGTSDFTYGHLRVNPIATHPEIKTGGLKLQKPTSGAVGLGFRDITMLTYWGSVIIEANTTGFAMEFIGDMNDSQTSYGTVANYMSSGVNLQ